LTNAKIIYRSALLSTAEMTKNENIPTANGQKNKPRIINSHSRSRSFSVYRKGNFHLHNLELKF
jgi:hypothetical protein